MHYAQPGQAHRLQTVNDVAFKAYQLIKFYSLAHQSILNRFMKVVGTDPTQEIHRMAWLGRSTTDSSLYIGIQGSDVPNVGRMSRENDNHQSNSYLRKT